MCCKKKKYILRYSKLLKQLGTYYKIASVTFFTINAKLKIKYFKAFAGDSQLILLVIKKQLKKN